MGDVLELRFSFSWPLARLAECFGIHRHSLAKKIRDAGVLPSGEYRGNPTYAVRDVAAVLFGHSAPGDTVDPDKLAPTDRKAWYESEVRRLDVARRMREVIPTDEVERVIATAFAAIASDLRALPDNLERKHGLDGELVREIENGIYAAMDSLADKLGELEVAEDAG